MDPQKKNYLGISFGLSEFDFEVKKLSGRLLKLLGSGTLLIGQLSVYFLFLRGESGEKKITVQ